MQEKSSILIIEDEEAIRNGLRDLFVFHGYDVHTSADGDDGLRLAMMSNYSAIILDVMLPGIDGYSICEEIRKHDRNQPIIMLTAKAAEDDRINGLALGADDYVAKPFSVRELVLRVEAVLRRGRSTAADEASFIIGDRVKIDSLNLTGVVEFGTTRERQVEFTRREVEILRYLSKNNSRPVSRGELLVQIWGYAKASSIETRTVDIHIAKLRKKIESDPENPLLLVTIRGEGYRLGAAAK